MNWVQLCSKNDRDSGIEDEEKNSEFDFKDEEDVEFNFRAESSEHENLPTYTALSKQALLSIHMLETHNSHTNDKDLDTSTESIAEDL